MALKYLVDACIWIDLLEERVGAKDEPFWLHAQRFLAHVRTTEGAVVVPDVLLAELDAYPEDLMVRLMEAAAGRVERLRASQDELQEALHLAEARGVSLADAAYAVMCRNRGCILITRDKGFLKLLDVCAPFQPEDLLGTA